MATLIEKLMRWFRRDVGIDHDAQRNAQRDRIGRVPRFARLPQGKPAPFAAQRDVDAAVLDLALRKRDMERALRQQGHPGAYAKRLVAEHFATNSELRP